MTPPPGLQDLIDTVRADTPAGSPLDQLATAAATVAQLEETSDALLGHFVDRCRRDGRSWTEISAALGVTKQAVHKRFATAVADRIIQANPAPTLERFTERARNVLSAAGVAARDAGRELAGSEHLLLGLFAEPDGVAARALQAMGVQRDAVKSAIQALPEPADAGEGGHFTADGRQALRDALAVALELGHNYIGTEHLLLGLYRNAGSPAAAVLAAVGPSEADAREHVLGQLARIQPSG
jgi:ATP-dependent Clp protease ATP-binding subunit ClpA